MSLREDARLQEFAEAELGALLEHEARHGGGLVDLLRQFLAVGGNKTELARVAHRNRTSLYPALRRLEELVGHPLDDPASRLSLGVALLAYDQGRDAGLTGSHDCNGAWPKFESVDDYLARAARRPARGGRGDPAPGARGGAGRDRGDPLRHADLAARRDVARPRRRLEAARLALPGPARGRRRPRPRPRAVRRGEGHAEDPVRRGRLRPGRARRCAGWPRPAESQPDAATYSDGRHRRRRGRSSSRRRRRRACRAAAVAGRTSRGPCSRPAPTPSRSATHIAPKTRPSSASWSPVCPAGSLTNCGRKATKKTIVFGLVRPTVKPTRSDRRADARATAEVVDGVEGGPGVGPVPDRLDAEPDDVRRAGDLQRRRRPARSRPRRRRGRRRPAAPGW